MAAKKREGLETARVAGQRTEGSVGGNRRTKGGRYLILKDEGT